MYIAKTYLNQCSYINFVILDKEEKNRYQMKSQDKVLIKDKTIVKQWDGISQREIYSQVGVVL